jgi:general secretion pathway protein G
MRPTSASCRRAEAAPAPIRRLRRARGRLPATQCRGRSDAGFTLLELLLVLTLVALLTGLVAPKLWAWVQAAQLRADVDRVRAQLEGLPQAAFADARRIDVAPGEPLALPRGWTFESSGPLVYEANGMTAGARLRLTADGTVVADWVVEPPAGTLRDAAAGDGPFRPGGGER